MLSIRCGVQQLLLGGIRPQSCRCPCGNQNHGMQGSDSSLHLSFDVNGLRSLPGQIVAAGRRRHWYMVDIAAGAVTRFPRLRNVPDRSLESFAVCRDAKARIPTAASAGATAVTAMGCWKSKAPPACALPGGLKRCFALFERCSYACLA